MILSFIEQENSYVRYAARHDESAAGDRASGYERLGRGTAWAYYVLLGFWFRLAYVVLFFVAGAALIMALPLALLERLGFFPWYVLNIPWIVQQGTAVYLLVAATISLFGLGWTAVGYSGRRWLVWHP